MEAGDRIDEWVNQYVRGVLSEKDRIELLRWLEAAPEHEKQFREMLRIKMRVSAVGQWKELDDVQQRTWDKITLFIECRRKKLYIWGARIASMIIVAIGVAFIWQNRSGSEMETILVSNVLQVESGSPKAILVTSAGEKIALNDGKTCQVADVSGIEIIQDSTGSVRFEDRGVVTEEEVCRYSSIVVPEKGEYQVILSDGTKVWINSDSKLEFPDRFHKNVREVKLTGEAYFQVAKDKEHPFIVVTGEAEIEALGTSFNIYSYEEENRIETTLVEGAVRFAVADQTVILMPGEQGVVGTDGNLEKKKVDVFPYIAWKEGKFVFRKRSLEEVMHIISRWYNVEAVFQNESLKKVSFSGNLKRYDDFEHIVSMLEMTGGIRFKVEGRKIFITEK